MAKKYLSLSEAAEQLGISEDALKARREANEIRGFADRGNWKFRAEDVEELGRSMTADSDPDVPILMDSGEVVVADTAADFVAPPAAGMGTEFMDQPGESVLDDDEFGENPTVIRKDKEDLTKSDSDVRLILDDSAAMSASDPALAEKAGVTDDSDSDVHLVPGTDSDVRLADGMFDDSDSDVKLVDGGDSVVIDEALAGDSDSDVRLSGGAMDIASDDALPVAADSDSDVQIAPDSASDVVLADSASEISLTDDSGSALLASDSDVRLVDEESALDLGDVAATAAAGAAAAGLAVGAAAGSDDAIAEEDSGVALEFDDEADDSASVLLGAEDSGIALAADSGIALEAVSDSGISLDTGELEEGISLAEDSGMLLADDSGIALEAIGDSGISLDDDSGIALETGAGSGVVMDGTDQEFDLVDSGDDVQATAFDIDGGDSEFDLDTEDATAEFDAADMLSGGDMEDSVEGDFDLGDDDFEDGTFDSLDAASVADIDLLDADDAFEDDFGDDAGESGYAAVPVGRGRVEQEWGTGTVVGVGVATLLSLLAAVMMFDLINNIYSWESGDPITGFIIEPLSGLFG